MGEKKILFMILLGVLISLALFFFKIKEEMIDFEVNYQAGERIGLGETLYRSEDAHYQFKYSPFSALLYLPLSFLPLPVAKGIWFAIILSSLSLILVFSSKLLHHEKEKSSFIILCSVLIIARFILRELQLGQINALLTFILVLMIWLLQDNKMPSMCQEILAGLLWGLAAALKPYAFIYFPYFILKKKWLTFSGGLFFIACSLFAPALFYGFSGNTKVLQEWVSSLSHSTPKLFSSQDNISLLGLLVKWTGNLNLSLIFFTTATVIIALFVFILILKGKKIARPILLESSLLLVLIPLLSPLGWDYTLLSSILGIEIVLKYFSRFPQPGRILLGANFLVVSLSLYDILGRKFYAAFMSWSVLTISFFILVASLGYLRLKGHC